MRDIIDSKHPQTRAELSLTDTETGPGVYETALAFTEPNRMAENTTLFKLVAKNLPATTGASFSPLGFSVG